jgi:RHS repeat-associated protein
METGGSGFNLGLVGETYANEPQTISYVDQNNTPRNISITYAPVTIDLPLLCMGNTGTCGVQIGTPAAPVVTYLPASIMLQNGDTYTINYLPDSLGEISSITLPTGGTISYMWGGVTPIGSGIMGRQVLSRTVTANGQSSTWQFQYPIASVTARTVTDPNMNDTVYAFGWLNANCPPPSPLVTQEVSYNGSQSANNPIATKTIGYTFYGSYLMDGTFLPTSNILTWNSAGLTTEADTTYDGALPAGTSCSGGPPTVTTRGNVVSKAVYDYGSAGSGTHGTLLSNTQLSYLYQSNSAYAAANIADRVSQVSVYNAASTLVAQTTTAYDGFSQTGQSGLAAAGWTTNHDNTNYGAGNTLRGLPTIVTKCSGPGSAPCSASITTYADYNILGQPTVTVDGKGYSTSYAYTSGAAPGGVDNGLALITTTTMPATTTSHVTQQYEDLNTGLSIGKKDQNKNLTEQTYDYRMRPLVTTRPDIVSGVNGTTTNAYPNPNQIITTVAESPSPNKITTTDLDGMGRKVSVSTTADTACGSLTVNTAYDLMSRVSAVSNPHCNSSQATDGWTQYAYDAISRLISKTNPDNSAQTWVINGNVIDSYDEVRNHWRRTYNAADWLTQVKEPPGTTASAAAPTLETDYSYDTLGNLLRVDQWGGPSGSANDHVRQFAYDGVSRLITSNNPESGPVAYLYDNNSNLIKKTDNRGISINYSYDQLNRLLSKSYSDSTPAVAYTYDTSSISSANNNGELTQATVQSGSTVLATSTYAYDPMGRLRNEQQCTPANCGSSPYNLAYGYDLGGKTISATFPSNAPTSGSTTPAGQPVTLSYVYDNAERLLTAGSSWSDSATHPATLFQASTGSSPAYGPMGLVNASIGVNPSNLTTMATLQRGYDNRGRTNNQLYASGNAEITGTPSAGSITISGTDAAPVTTPTTHGTGGVSFSGGDGMHPTCTTITNPYTTYTTCGNPLIPDSGWIYVTIGSSPPFTAAASFNSTSTGSTIAAGLAAALNVSGSPVTAVASGSTITITAVVAGPGGNYPFTVSTYSNGSGDFSYQSSGASLQGGQTGGTFYDTGTMSVTVNGAAAQANWGQGSTASSVASSLASAINAAAGGYVVATPSGSGATATVNLASRLVGPETNWAVTATATETDTAHFSTPGFSVSAANMSGGSNTTGQVLYSYSMPNAGSFAPNGNLLNVADSVTGAWTYTYDNLNRLVGAAAVASALQGMENYYAGLQTSFGYDAFGNRTVMTQGGTPAHSVPSSSTAYYTASSNQVASMTYDAAGDVIYDGLNSYLYDAEGRLCAVRNYVGVLTGYLYDAAGTRVAKGSLATFSCNFAPTNFTPATSWVLGPGGEQVTEYSTSCPANGWCHTNAFSAGQLQATYHDTGTYFYLGDWLGTKRVEVGASGCISAYAGLPFGDGLTPVSVRGYASCVDATEHHFTGKERDTESGNDYFGARYYASAVGRFMSPDWGAQEEPVPYAKLDNPQTLNLYSYVENNPLTSTDPTGHEGCCDVLPTMDEVDAVAKPLIDSAVTGVEDAAGVTVQGALGVVGFLFTAGVGSTATASHDQLYNEDTGERYVPEPQAASGGAMKGTGRGGQNDDTKAGQDAHRDFSEKAKAKGWQVEPRLTDPKTGQTVKPDAVTGTGKPVELKPNTASGRAKGRSQLKKYERATGKKGRVVYYDKPKQPNQ